MCLQTTTRWPCGHESVILDYCDKNRNPPKRRLGLRQHTARRKNQPLVPCEEVTEEVVLAADNEVCPEPACPARTYWVCHECPRPEGLRDYDGRAKTLQGRQVFDQDTELPPELRDQLNVGQVCGSSETGEARCGHQRCYMCLGFRICLCTCGCSRYLQMPPMRVLCRTCFDRKCPERAKTDEATEDLDAALAATAGRLEYSKVYEEMLVECGDGLAHAHEEEGEFYEYAVEEYYEAGEESIANDDA